MGDGVSAIRNEISAATISVQVRLERAVHKGSFLLVEGDTDARLYLPFIDGKQCSIINCVNRNNVENAILILDEMGFKGALGIVDGDFAEIANDNLPSPNLVRTHGNDAEVMIVSSAALDKVLLHYGSAQKIAQANQANGLTVRELIAVEAAKVGIMRVAAKRRGWSIKFRNMNYSFSSNTSIEIDEHTVSIHVLARTGQQAPPAEEFRSACDEVRALGVPMMQLVNGHDFVRVLARALKRELGTYNAFENDPVELEKVLRIAYERQHFEGGNLYRDIRLWEAANEPYIVLVH